MPIDLLKLLLLSSWSTTSKCLTSNVTVIDDGKGKQQK